MGHRLTKIYTRTGDDGKTQIAPGERISKDDALIEALGVLDELNSAIGIIAAYRPANPEIRYILTQLQHDLFNAGSELCPPYQLKITDENVLFLEDQIDHWNALLPPLLEFILPGGNLASASCHLARSICRRAERRLVTLQRQESLNPDLIRYINRLSDLLFVIARILMKETNEIELLWESDRIMK